MILNDIEGTFAKHRINIFNLDFIKVLSKILSKSDFLFRFLGKFSRGK